MVDARWNLIRHLGGLKSCKALSILELYENRIKSSTRFKKLVNWKALGLSYDRIRDEGVPHDLEKFEKSMLSKVAREDRKPRKSYVN